MTFFSIVCEELCLVRQQDVDSFVHWIYRTATGTVFFLSRLLILSFKFVLSNYQFIAKILVLRALVWMAVWAIFIYIDFGSLWVIISLFALIFMNLGEKKSADDISAYSVFNKGFQRILGTIDVEQFENELRHNNIRWEDDGNNEENEFENVDEDENYEEHLFVDSEEEKAYEETLKKQKDAKRPLGAKETKEKLHEYSKVIRKRILKIRSLNAQ
jgi:hypothetical protein